MKKSISSFHYEGSDLEALSQMPNYYEWIVEIFRQNLRGHVMEIGSGIGTISQKLVAEVDQLDLVEPSKNLTQFLPNSLKENEKISLYSENLETHLPKVQPMTFDAIVMVNVLEHIQYDRDALIELRRTLKPGGHLLLFVPALEFLFSELDSVHGHFRRYQKNNLELLIEESGLSVEYSRYFDIAGVVPWWLINKVFKQTKFAPRAIDAYDSYIVPITKFIEHLIPPPIGKNIILKAVRN